MSILLSNIIDFYFYGWLTFTFSTLNDLISKFDFYLWYEDLLVQELFFQFTRDVLSKFL